ncbi:HOG (high osmolarity glycerol) pathway protein [Elasticomyces elasticus]|nr:HOG (high osmolarity glycerol) pathway protein [Elasticomyces elasticus]
MSSSRPPSTTTTTTPFPNFQSALAYTLVRDFAWPDFHPLHYGAPDLDSASGATTPASEWPGGSRRLSDPDAQFGGGGGGWSAGPWGGDGVMYGDPEESTGFGDGGVEALPATSFGEEGGEDDGVGGSGRRKHRKSRSYANMTDYERGRRRESAQNPNSFRRSRVGGTSTTNTTGTPSAANNVSREAGGGEGAGGDIFTFHGLSSSSQSQSQYDPAGRDSLRQSRGYINTGPSTNLSSSSSLSAEASARSRADSHFQTMLPSRSFGRRSRQGLGVEVGGSAGQGREREPGTPFDPDTHMPLDTEAPLLPPPQNLRESLGPEDEELYAGRSLALYPFEPENSNELRLREGQVIMGWLVAEDAETGEQGLVPEEYVRLLSELPHYDEVSGQFMDPEEGEDLGGVGGDGGEEREEDDEDESGDVETEEVEVDTSEVEVVGAGGGGGGHGGGKGKETRVDTPESGVEGEVHEMGGGEVRGGGGR